MEPINFQNCIFKFNLFKKFLNNSYIFFSFFIFLYSFINFSEGIFDFYLLRILFFNFFGWFCYWLASKEHPLGDDDDDGWSRTREGSRASLCALMVTGGGRKYRREREAPACERPKGPKSYAIFNLAKFKVKVRPKFCSYFIYQLDFNKTWRASFFLSIFLIINLQFIY